jgi:hypothetical protein
MQCREKWWKFRVHDFRDARVERATRSWLD